MSSRHPTAKLAGVIFIIATVAVLFAGAVDPLLAAPDFLRKITENANQISISSLLYLVAAFTSVGIAVALYPVLSKINSGLAVGSVVFRTLEAVFYIVAIASLLCLLPLSEKFISAGAADQHMLQTIGNVLLNLRNQATLLGVFAFCVGAFMYYLIFFQSRLIPRWLSGWGIVAIILMFVACVLALFSGKPITGYTALIVPIALQEMVLAVWLIAKGFSLPTTESGSA